MPDAHDPATDLAMPGYLTAAHLVSRSPLRKQALGFRCVYAGHLFDCAFEAEQQANRDRLPFDHGAVTS